MLAQLVQNLFHLEGGEDGFDQHGRLDGSLGNAEFVLRHAENVVPQPCFQMAFHLRQVVERASAPGDLLLGVVEEHQAEVENAAGHALTVNQHVLLVQMPTARANLQRGNLVVQLVFLAHLVDVADLAADGVLQIDLTLNLVKPVGAVGILKVGHVGISARVVGVDDHLGFDRAGDFGAAALQRLGQRRNFPGAFADRFGLRQEVGHLAGVNADLALDAGFQQFLTARLESAMQFGDERQRIVGQNLVETGIKRGVHLHASRQIKAHGNSSDSGLLLSNRDYFSGFQQQKPGGRPSGFAQPLNAACPQGTGSGRRALSGTALPRSNRSARSPTTRRPESRWSCRRSSQCPLPVDG